MLLRFFTNYLNQLKTGEQMLKPIWNLQTISITTTMEMEKWVMKIKQQIQKIHNFEKKIIFCKQFLCIKLRIKTTFQEVCIFVLLLVSCVIINCGKYNLFIGQVWKNTYSILKEIVKLMSSKFLIMEIFSLIKLLKRSRVDGKIWNSNVEHYFSLTGCNICKQLKETPCTSSTALCI